MTDRSSLTPLLGAWDPGVQKTCITRILVTSARTHSHARTLSPTYAHTIRAYSAELRHIRSLRDPSSAYGTLMGGLIASVDLRCPCTSACSFAPSVTCLSPPCDCVVDKGAFAMCAYSLVCPPAASSSNCYPTSFLQRHYAKESSYNEECGQSNCMPLVSGFDKSYQRVAYAAHSQASVGIME